VTLSYQNWALNFQILEVRAQPVYADGLDVGWTGNEGMWLINCIRI
jgi:hypothetical protein